jgi:protein-S-isoprenylcysteine O-methyltransferase Ste14
MDRSRSESPSKELPKALRRVFSILLGAAFLILVFVYWPHEVLEARWAAAWPRWTFQSQPGWIFLGRILGGTLILAGAGIFGYCTFLFGRKGSGTPVPTDPPERLVISGPFRWSRNPMYLAYTMILVGETLVIGHTALLLYTAICTAAFHCMAVGEEVLLRRRFGEPYERYLRQVPRWLGPRSLRG